MDRHPAITATVALFLLLSVWWALDQEDLTRLVKRIQPAVVTVVAYDARGKPHRQGSGFFINQEGRFITNYHVLAGACRAEVTTPEGRRYPVRGVVAEDCTGDLLVAAIEPPGEDVPTLHISNTLPEVGERVVVVGSPLGLEQTLSEGLVSAVRTIPGIGQTLQITAPLSPGSSGSPVINLRGEVIGVAALQAMAGQSLNFAVPGRRALALSRKPERVSSESHGSWFPVLAAHHPRE